ncbi:Cell division control protein Cdc25 [Mycena indigotica]|uniref:Cell division control protein Cdc25 n=1 Tax=Mycena indigotica TaxID=2126181 RepID=A0A8H6S299_9AGAR|nr:Cell division control protein Cdc25 [Mycena indigotica]KAF7290532.1 Cell division control protein Cdc25 [Mycena indigotica]
MSDTPNDHLHGIQRKSGVQMPHDESEAANVPPAALSTSISTIEDIYPSLKATARSLRSLTAPQQFDQLVTVIPVFLSATQSILRNFRADTFLMSFSTPAAIHNAIARTCLNVRDWVRRLSGQEPLVENEIKQTIQMTDSILHCLFLLHQTSDALKERIARKPLPGMPGNETTEEDAPNDDDEARHSPTAPTSASVSGSSLGRETRRSETLSPISPLEETPTDAARFETLQSFLYDCSDPASPADTVEMPIPELMIHTDTDGHLQAASFSSLVLLLTSFQALGLDENMAETFFLSFRLFSSPEKLMDVFEARWDVPKPPSAYELSPSQERVWQRHVVHVRNSIAHLVITWLEDYWRHDKDISIVARLRSFIEGFKPNGVLESDADLAIKSLELALERKFLTRFEHAKAAAASRKTPEVVAVLPFAIHGACDFDILGLNSPQGVAQLSEQFAWKSQSHYLKIDPEDLVRSWLAEAPSFCELQRFEENTLVWVVHSVVTQESRADRVRIVQFWLAVATTSVELRNFSAASSIFGGLVYASVERLWKTILELSVESKEQYRALDNLLNGYNNYSVYRRAVAAYDLPTVPIMTVLRKDVISAKQITGMPQNIEGRGDEKLINLHAFRKLNTVIQFMESCFVIYKIDPLLRHQGLILGQTTVPPDMIADMEFEADRLSLALEPTPPKFIKKGQTWLQVIDGSVDDPTFSFTIHDLPAQADASTSGPS